MPTGNEYDIPLPWDAIEWDGQGPNVGSLNTVIQNLQGQILDNQGASSALTGFATVSPDSGTVSATTSFAAALATGLPIAVAKFTNGVYLLTSSVTIPSTSALWGMGGVLKPALGVNIVVNGPIYCPDGVPLFDLSLGGTISGQPKCKLFMANWIVGCEPGGTGDSTAAIQAGLNMCTGQFKPSLGLLAGSYVITSTLLKPDSFYCPVIQGVPGGTSDSTLLQCTLNASASSLLSSQPVLRILGGSGKLSNGGLRDVSILGNNVCIGLQISGQTGVINERGTITNCALDVHLWNERANAATEWIMFRDYVFQKSPSSALGTYVCTLEKTGGFDSFHGLAFENCWMNLGGRAWGFNIGTGVYWYDGWLDTQVFFNSSAASGIIANTPQYLFHWQGGGGNRPIEIGGGAVKCEGGLGFGRLAENNRSTTTVVYHGGTVPTANGIQFGNFYLVDSVTRFGAESPGNGSTMSRRRRYGDSNLNLTAGANTALQNIGISQLYDVIVESNRTGAVYYSRHVGMALYPDNANGTTGRWLELERPRLFNSVTYNPASLAFGISTFTTVTVTGAVLGNKATAAFSLDLQGLTMTAYVSALNTVTVILENAYDDGINPTATINLASGNLQVEVSQETHPGWLIIDQGAYGWADITVDSSNRLVITNANYPARVVTTTNTAEVLGSSVIGLSTVVGISVGDKFYLALDNGEIFIANITAVGAADVTISKSLTSDAASGNSVVTAAMFWRYNVLPMGEAIQQWGQYAYNNGIEGT